MSYIYIYIYVYSSRIIPRCIYMHSLLVLHNTTTFKKNYMKSINYSCATTTYLKITRLGHGQVCTHVTKTNFKKHIP